MVVSYGGQQYWERQRTKAQLPGSEPFHEQHWPTALRAAPQAGLWDGGIGPGISTSSRRWISFDQLSTQGKECGAVASAEDPEVSNADEARG